MAGDTRDYYTGLIMAGDTRDYYTGLIMAGCGFPSSMT